MMHGFSPRRWIAVAVLCGLSSPLLALDLLESYTLALQRDAEYQAARAAAEGGRELLPLARAQLLPSVTFNASRFQNDLTTETRDFFGQTRTSETRYPSHNYALSLRQPLYRPALWAGLDQAKARVEGVEAAFDKAGQDLALRVIGAYLNVLLAQEAHRQVETQGQAFEAQLAAAQHALVAGQGTRIDVDEAQAKLDLNRARLLSARQQIDQARHELEILIGMPVGKLRPLGSRLPPLESLQPATLEDWIARAEEANPELRDLRARVAAARHEVARASAGHKPTLDLVLQKSQSESDSVTSVNNRYDNSQIGLQLAVPLFSGGYVSAQVRQAAAGMAEAESRLETARRRLATLARKEFRAVQEGVAKVAALEVAERSAELSLLSNEKGFQAGTRSRLDILNAIDARATARYELAKERLHTFMARARLLALVGGLDHASVAEMNRWLVE